MNGADAAQMDGNNAALPTRGGFKPRSAASGRGGGDGQAGPRRCAGGVVWNKMAFGKRDNDGGGGGGGAAVLTRPLVAPPGRDLAPSADPDALLVRRHLAGDSAAFEALFRKYQTPIFNLVTRMVRGEDAYDITQDVFLKALKALKTFRGDAKFSTWLYTIARHTCLNYLRHKAVIDEESMEGREEDNPATELVDGNINVARASETRELQRAVDAILATLPHEARLLLILRDFEQLSYDEISQVTELSIVNVKSKIHRARQVFKKRFTPYLELIEGELGK